MVENWIKINKYGENCKITFSDMCDIILDDEDVKHIIKGLVQYMILKEKMEAIH